jgi:hypothetical protein
MHAYITVPNVSIFSKFNSMVEHLCSPLGACWLQVLACPAAAEVVLLKHVHVHITARWRKLGLQRSNAVVVAGQHVHSVRHKRGEQKVCAMAQASWLPHALN